MWLRRKWLANKNNRICSARNYFELSRSLERGMIQSKFWYVYWVTLKSSKGICRNCEILFCLKPKLLIVRKILTAPEPRASSASTLRRRRIFICLGRSDERRCCDNHKNAHRMYGHATVCTWCLHLRVTFVANAFQTPKSEQAFLSSNSNFPVLMRLNLSEAVNYDRLEENGNNFLPGPLVKRLSTRVMSIFVKNATFSVAHLILCSPGKKWTCSISVLSS